MWFIGTKGLGLRLCFVVGLGFRGLGFSIGLLLSTKEVNKVTH